MAVIWPDTSVSDNSLTRAIAQIRKALGDDPKAPRYIETVPSVGYRFIGHCKEEEEQSPIPLTSHQAQKGEVTKSSGWSINSNFHLL